MPEDLRSALRVVLVRPRNPLNIGAVARAISNFGFEQLRVVNPYEVAFREAKSAVGASHVLGQAEQYTSVAEAVGDCGLVVGTTAVGQREIQQPLRRLQQAGEIIRNQSGRVALLFGSEKRGLSNEDFSYCHWLAHIPTSQQNLSMNLGQAVAVCLYELVREAGSKSVLLAPDPAKARELDRLTDVLTESLLGCGYTKPNTEEATAEKTRRLIRRLNLSGDDAQLLIGMLRKIGHRRP